MIEKNKGEILIQEARALMDKYGVKTFVLQFVDAEGDVMSLKFKSTGGRLTKVGKVRNSPLIVSPGSGL